MPRHLTDVLCWFYGHNYDPANRTKGVVSNGTRYATLYVNACTRCHNHTTKRFVWVMHPEAYGYVRTAGVRHDP